MVFYWIQLKRKKKNIKMHPSHRGGLGNGDWIPVKMSSHLQLNNDGCVAGLSTTIKLVGSDAIPASNIFKVEQKWVDKAHLKSALEFYASATGWSVCNPTPTHFRCNCFRKPGHKDKYRDHQTPRQVDGGSLHKGCTFLIAIRSTKNERSKDKSKPVFDAGVPIIISKVILSHGGSCNPSPQQQLVARARSGKYVKSINDLALYQLCTMSKNGEGRLKTSSIKSIITPFWPSNKNISKGDIYNLRRKIKRIIPHMDHLDNFEAFQQYAKVNKLHSGLDDVPLNEHESTEIAKELWLQIMSERTDEESIVTFKEYMDLMVQKADGNFKYELLSDSNGVITGCVWQTATMRANFERYGSFISVDAMKRGINKWLWPYIAITMYNELDMVCVGCESIICTERIEAYESVINFCLDNSPGRSREDIYVLTADGIITQDVVSNDFSLPNCHFMADWHHLFESLPKLFGPSYTLISSKVREMVTATSSEKFEHAYTTAMEILTATASFNQQHIDTLIDFKSKKESYSSYILSKTRGTRGKHGSSLSESNHSSVLIHLNDGDKYKNNYCEEPMTLVKDLFLREQFLVNKFNSVLYGEKVKLETELHILRNENSEQCLIDAAGSLSLKSYQRFKMRVGRLNEYCCEFLEDDTAKVFSKKFVTAPARLLHRGHTDGIYRCRSCEASISYEEMCEHELLANSMTFLPTLFAQWHFRRDTVKGTKIVTDDSSAYAANIDVDSANGDDIDMDSVVGTEIEHWEEEEVTNTCETKATAPLPKKDITDIMKEVPHRYEHCSDDTKYMVGALVLCMEKLLKTDGQSTLFDSSAHVHDDNVLQYLTSIVQSHGQHKFTKTNMFTRPDMPSELMIRKQSKKRLMSRREHIKQSSKKIVSHQVVVNTKEESSCGYCSGKGHRYTNCDIRKELAAKGAEYIVSLEETKNDASRLRNRLEYNAILQYYDEKQHGTIARNVSNKSRGVFIHNLYLQNCQHPLVGYSSLSDLAIEVSFLAIGSKQEEISTKERMLIAGESMNTFISQSCGRKVKSFIYDGTAFKAPPNRQIQQNLSQSLSQNFILQPQVFGPQLGHLSQPQYPMPIQPIYFTQPSQHYLPLSQQFQHDVTEEEQTTEFKM
ncbi:hypothetical protein CTEN210_11872 [Chaetoceros tenuissimus]|uniref:Uncharacterized protein n=1 Tax=Chaetoceros tenuissimus TaxID=426638 RepID=A0AAD3H9P9_9STRA|nr:hypothetical protein CTEN210_11872 [Chaetoceros tenuissimus]